MPWGAGFQILLKCKHFAVGKPTSLKHHLSFVASPHSVCCYCRGLTAGRGASSKLKSTRLLELLKALEEGSRTSMEEIFISPDSAAWGFTDEDSGHEDNQQGGPLPSSVLHASVVPEDDMQPRTTMRREAAVAACTLWTKRDILPDLSS